MSLSLPFFYTPEGIFDKATIARLGRRLNSYQVVKYTSSGETAHHPTADVFNIFSQE
jgi:hypothetical protein